MTGLSWASKPAPAAPSGAARPHRSLRSAVRLEPNQAPLPVFSGPAEDDLAALFGPLIGLMSRASRRILHDDDLADDAIQETLLTFWTRAERPINPRAWLLHAVTLRSLHLARSSRRRREHERQACLSRSEWSIQDDPSRSLDHAELVQTLQATVDRLPDEYRAVFRLWTFEEMDYAAIAATLRIPIGTVRSRLNRTRRLIRAALTATDPDASLAF